MAAAALISTKGHFSEGARSTERGEGDMGLLELIELVMTCVELFFRRHLVTLVADIFKYCIFRC